MVNTTCTLALLLTGMVGALAIIDPIEFRTETLAEYTLTDGETDESFAVLKVYKYFDTRSLSHEPVRESKHPRQGYVLTGAHLASPEKLEVLWGRRIIPMHLREPPTEIGLIWWDDRQALLWIVLVMSVTQQSVVEIHALPLIVDSERGRVALAKDSPVLRTTTVLSHSRGEPDRVSEVTIRPEGLQNVVLEFSRHDDAADVVQMTVQKGRMREYGGIELEDIVEALRSGR